MIFKRFLGVFLCLLTSGRSATYNLPEIKVTAQKDGLLYSETLLTEAYLDHHQQTTAVDALQPLSGVHVVQNGSAGHVASVFIRGGNSDQVRVMLDGMPVSTPSTPSGAYDFGHLNVEGQTLKVIRGPNSASYGSGAMAGVVDMTTQKAQEPFMATMVLEGGSFSTAKSTFTMRGLHNDADISFTANQLCTQSPPTTPVARRITAREWGLEKHVGQSFATRAGYEFKPQWRVNLWNRYQGFETHYPNIYLQNPSAQDHGRLWLHRIQIEGSQGMWSPTASIGYVRQDHISKNDQAPYLEHTENSGKTIRVDQTNAFRFSSIYTLYLIAAQEREAYTLHTQTILRQKANGGTKELATGHTLTPLQNLTLEGWVRVHNPNGFRQESSYRTSVSYEQGKTHYFASFGKAIKTPSLRQLFDTQGGNRALLPEISHGWDGGVHHKIRPFLTVGATYFSTRLDRMIENQLVSPGRFTYINIRKAQIYGTETFVQWQPKNWTLRLDYTFLHAKDQATHAQLLRRPLHKVGFQAQYAVTEKWSTGAGVIFYGKQADMNRYEPYNRIYLGSTTLVRLFTRYEVNQHCQWFARVENLLNRPYEMPSGYLQPRFSVFTGIKLVT